MTTDTSEKALEALIARDLTEERGFVTGEQRDYDRDYGVDLAKLSDFLRHTQPGVNDALDVGRPSATRQKFLARLQGEITKRGVIDVLRKGVKHGAHEVDLYSALPSPENPKAAGRFALNRFSVTRQLRYSRDETTLALDLVLFVNGLPVVTFELKNNLTKQTYDDAIVQYKRDRDPRELLFQFGRCIAHFAVDDQQAWFCTELKGGESWFLPFNKGWNDGAGNPPNPDGLKTDYLWKETFTREGLADLIENYAQVVDEADPRTGRSRRVQIFPRYHQLDVVRKLLATVPTRGLGRPYLIQHSAGSGKSNSIAWLLRQMLGLRHDGADLFDSIIVVTDRVLLDRQIRDTIKQFQQVSATVGHAEGSGDLRDLIASGKKVIITTVQKFPFVLDDIGNEHRNGRFAIVIDEAHSSQGGRTSAAMAAALSRVEAEDEDDTLEDRINRIVASRKMLTNANYFAFTATPKSRTLEMFGEPFGVGGVTKHRPFHTYTMKQAIEEGFILDVLKYYTPVDSYYRLVKSVEGDPEFDTKRAKKKLRSYVEGHDRAIRAKAEIMVDHFHEQVAGLNKIGGQARAMVVTSGIAQALQYFAAFRDYLIERGSPYRAIVAFSGEHEFGGAQVTEASLNGFPSNLIAERIREHPYRFLICADKFQTGYDEPLLHTMYVDKPLSGIKAVQTLSRLNRAHPKKHDVFVLDFENDIKTIQLAFADYYRTTMLAEETDPNKLHDLKATLDAAQVYAQGHIDQFVALYLGEAARERLDPILDACVATYLADLDESGQVEFKGRAKAFTRTYAFLSALLPYTNATWEKLSIFLNFLVTKLPAPREDDLSRGILQAIDMDSYRVEKRAALAIQLPDENAELANAMISDRSLAYEPEIDRLSNILKAFNEHFGNISWTDGDRVRRMITEEIPAKVAADRAFDNARKNSDRQNARIEHDQALARVMTALLSDDTELFRLFSDNESFRKWIADTIFTLTYDRPAA